MFQTAKPFPFHCTLSFDWLIDSWYHRWVKHERHIGAKHKPSNNDKSTKSPIKVWFIVQITRQFMFVKDWENSKLTEPLKVEIRQGEFLALGEACSVQISSPWPTPKRKPLLAVGSQPNGTFSLQTFVSGGRDGTLFLHPRYPTAWSLFTAVGWHWQGQG